MGALTVDDLDRMLTRLKLTAIRDQLDTLLDEAVRLLKLRMRQDADAARFDRAVDRQKRVGRGQ